MYREVTRRGGESRRSRSGGPISYRITMEIKNDVCVGGDQSRETGSLRQRGATDAAEEPCSHEQRRGQGMIDRWVSGAQRRPLCLLKLNHAQVKCT